VAQAWKTNRYLRAFSDICRYYPHINEILTCHMEYTESLPPPPGTHEAWPTKPRSVSHWPDWKPAGYLQADLAACEHWFVWDAWGQVGPPSTASFAKFSRIKRYQGKILAVTNVLVQVPAENLKCKFLYRYMSCPQTFAKIPTDQWKLCERGCTETLAGRFIGHLIWPFDHGPGDNSTKAEFSEGFFLGFTKQI